MLVHAFVLLRHLFSKYGHYEAELSLGGLLVEINERQPRAKKRRQLGLSAPGTGAAAPRGPAEEAEEAEEAEGARGQRERRGGPSA